MEAGAATGAEGAARLPQTLLSPGSDVPRGEEKRRGKEIEKRGEGANKMGKEA